MTTGAVGPAGPVYSELPAGADVVVVGAGIVGLAVARELAGRGRDVVVLDAGLPGSGTSSRGEGNLLLSDKEIPDEARLAVRSLELWQQLAEESPVDFEYEQKGGVVVARSEEALTSLVHQADAQARLGIDSEILDLDALLSLEPNLSPDLTGGLLYPADAQVQPILAVQVLLSLASGEGVSVVPDCEVLGAVRSRAATTLRTSGGSVSADMVVCAAGPWSGEVARRLGGRAPVFPRRGLLLVTEALPPGAIRHKVYDGGYVAAVASDEAVPQTAPVLEGTRAGTILIGSSREAVGWDDSLPWDLAGALARSATDIVPALASVSVIRAYQGFRPATADHLPLIGPDPQVPGLFHATGHEGAGIGLSLATAEHLADLVDAPLTSPFDPGRLDATAVDTLDPGHHGDLAASPFAPAEPPVPETRLASALLTKGRHAWRRTRFDHAPRGLFCGIGDCFDCLVLDDRGRTVRACLVGEGRGWSEHEPAGLL